MSIKAPPRLELTKYHIIKSTITRCLIEEQPESDKWKELMETNEARNKVEFKLTSIRQDQSRVGFWQKGFG